MAQLPPVLVCGVMVRVALEVELDEVDELPDVAEVPSSA
jgi:hypothetical protein